MVDGNETHNVRCKEMLITDKEVIIRLKALPNKAKITHRKSVRLSGKRWG